MVSGASGFVGSALVTRLAQEGHEVVAPVRSAPAHRDPRVVYVEGVDLTRPRSWIPALTGAEAVIHAAARVHQLHDQAADPLDEYRRVNVDGTVGLGIRAAEAGVKRFIFLSSIKVNGEKTEPGSPFRSDDEGAPIDPYGISKQEAETALFQLGRSTGMEVVVVRPPLVYGPGVKANFRSMMRLLHKGVPIPLGAVTAKRSLIALDNLVDLLSLCLRHPKAPGQVLLVSDAEDLSVADMLRRLGRALDRPARLVSVPTGLIERAAWILGKKALATRLCASLQVDTGPTSRLLDWTPPVSVDEAFKRTADDFKARGDA